MTDPGLSEILQKINLANKPVDFDAWADADEGQHVAPATDYEEAVMNARFRPTKEAVGYMCWANTREDVQIRPGELSIWAGKRGSGKSLITGQVVAGLIDQGQKAVIASMEMPIVTTLDRMMGQVLAQASPTEEYAREFFKWSDGKLFLYEQDGTVPAKRLLGLARYSAVELGIQNIVIDSLMMVGVDATGSFQKQEAQGQFVRSLATIAKDTGCHIHLVCHMRKSETGGNGRSEADDVAGTAAITDVASCVYIISINRKKLEEAKKNAPDQKIMEQPDVRLDVEKNRNGPTGGYFGLWAHKSLQYVSRGDGKPMKIARGLKEIFTNV